VIAESVAELFHENTRATRILGRGVATPPEFALEQREAMARAYKLYRRHPRVALPRPPRSDASFDDVIAARRSVRDFADDDLEVAELAKVLHQAYGITSAGRVQSFRSAPSAGALYPGELYVGVRRVAGLDPGIYHYELPDHALALLRPGDPTALLDDAYCGQRYASEAGAVVLAAGALRRTKHKYGERGYRYVLLDVGHLMENLVLSATALGLAVVTTAGFFDDAANELLRLDGVDEAVLYIAFVGRRQEVIA
jgi:SagB-type dehydrogenase family enzyme